MIQNRENKFESGLRKLFDKLILAYSLPPESIDIVVNTSPSGKKIMSYSICIIEKPYPTGLQAAPRKTVVAKYICGDSIKLFVKREQFKLFNIENYSVEIKDSKSDKAFIYVFFNLDDDIFSYISDVLRYNIEHYAAGSSFSCCGKYSACSRELKCVHSNTLYAKGCYYRKNLESGNVFY